MTRYVGAPVPRLEDGRLLTGRGRYLDDLDDEGALHAAFVRSPVAHARVVSVDVAAARAAPGVVGAFAADDLPERWREPMRQLYPSPLIGQDVTQPVLAAGEVCFVGQTVAVVVAESRYLAEDAAELVDVTYEELPAIVDCRAALEPGAPPTHVASEGNRMASLRTAFGDVDAAFASAAHVVAADALQHRGGCHSMETRGVLARDDPHGDGLTVWTSTQSPYLIRRALAREFGEDEEAIRVIAPDVGGGFGPKAAFYPEEIVVPLLARELGRPVKWVEDRREHFVATNTTRDQHWAVEAAVDADGRILGVRGRVVADCGAYAPYGVLLPLTSLTPLPGAYAIPALDVAMDVVFTNTTPNSAVRGAGRPYGIFAIERLVEAVAHRLGLDPAEVRRRNLVRAEQMPYATGAKARDGSPIVYDSGDFPACLERALELADYDGFPARQRAARAEGRYLGIGIGTCIEDTGVGPFEGATVRVTPGGRIVVRTGAASQGQGHATIVAQVVADRLGVTPADVSVDAADTARFAHGAGTIGSRVAANLGPAAHDAAGRVAETALRLAAELLEAAPSDLELADGHARVIGAPERRVALGELALRLAPPTGGRVPAGFEASLEATSYLGSSATPIANGTNVAEVDVDLDTGHVHVVRYSVAHDCGVLLNPQIVDGQIVGGVVHGIGNALFERAAYHDNGQPAATSYLDYLLPAASEMPEVAIAHLESPSPLNALGVKGAGEGGTIPAIPAIVAAIESALAPFSVVIDGYPVDPAALVERIRVGRAAR